MDVDGCPQCGAPAEVAPEPAYDDGAGDTVSVTCVAHHHFLGPRELLAPRLPWDLPQQRTHAGEEVSPALARQRELETVPSAPGPLIGRERHLRFGG